MSRRVFRVNLDPSLRHGTSYSYSAKGCRCDDCYDYWRATHERRKRDDPTYMAKRRAASYRWYERQRAERIQEAGA